MLSNDEAVAQFKEILGSKEGWRYLKDSQFFSHLSTFQAWALRSAQFDAERTLQEFFLSTALNRSSISAQAEDKGYLPRTPFPSFGGIQVKNNGVNPVTIPIYQGFQSNIGLQYLIKYPITILSGQSAEATCYQLTRTVVSTVVPETTPFFEILFDISLTASIHQVDVDISDESGFVTWSLSRQLRNAGPASTVYDLFYSHDGQIGVRFGNGIFGKKPEASNTVRCTLWLTSGDTTLLESLPLLPIGTVTDSMGVQASIDIKTITKITGGFGGESTEELRKNLMYWPLYNDNLVWLEDYEFFLRRQIPEIRWLKVWGEKEAEAEAGFSNAGNINSIFVSAYIHGAVDTEARIVSVFNAIKLYNRRIRWVAPEFVTANITLAGKISRQRTIENVSSDITDALSAAYGKDSATRRDRILIKDVYQIVSDTKNFGDSGASFAVTVSGTTQTEKLKQMLCLGTISFALEYL